MSPTAIPNQTSHSRIARRSWHAAAPASDRPFAAIPPTWDPAGPSVEVERFAHARAARRALAVR
jgi:hypothetical protein